MCVQISILLLSVCRHIYTRYAHASIHIQAHARKDLYTHTHTCPLSCQVVFSFCSLLLLLLMKQTWMVPAGLELLPILPIILWEAFFVFLSITCAKMLCFNCLCNMDNVKLFVFQIVFVWLLFIFSHLTYGIYLHMVYTYIWYIFIL